MLVVCLSLCFLDVFVDRRISAGSNGNRQPFYLLLLKPTQVHAGLTFHTITAGKQAQRKQLLYDSHLINLKGCAF